ncbi:MAG: pilus assembly FimT family protein [Cellulosilyticaceae bacterium]
MPKQSGMTLVEMTVVLAIIAILSSTMSIGFNMVKLYEYNQFIQKTVTLIQHSQQEASARNIMVNVEKRQIGNKTVMCQIQQGEIKQKIEVPKSVDISINGNRIICFDKDMSVSEAKTITIMHKGLNKKNELTISVATGKIRIYS